MQSEKFKLGTKIKCYIQVGEIVEYNDQTQQYTVQWERNGKPFTISFYNLSWLENHTEILN